MLRRRMHTSEFRFKVNPSISRNLFETLLFHPSFFSGENKANDRIFPSTSHISQSLSLMPSHITNSFSSSNPRNLDFCLLDFGAVHQLHSPRVSLTPKVTPEAPHLQLFQPLQVADHLPQHLEKSISRMTSKIPEFILLCQDKAFIIAFNEALSQLWPRYHPDKIKITTLNERLNSLPPSTTFDLIVSPANSYGRLDGAFDHAISKTFSPPNDYHAITRAAQLVLYDKWRGFAPPGTCTLVEFPEALKANNLGCKWVALCPTMREPQDVNWDREVVYECVWSLLCQVEGHNRRSSEQIETVLMTPLAAGVGKVSKERWAAQTVTAMRHFVDAVERPQIWSSLQWDSIEKICDDVSATWEDKSIIDSD